MKACACGAPLVGLAMAAKRCAATPATPATPTTPPGCRPSRATTPATPTMPTTPPGCKRWYWFLRGGGRRALARVLLLCLLGPWTLCPLFYSLLHLTYPRDKAEGGDNEEWERRREREQVGCRAGRRRHQAPALPGGGGCLWGAGAQAVRAPVSISKPFLLRSWERASWRRGTIETLALEWLEPFQAASKYN